MCMFSSRYSYQDFSYYFFFGPLLARCILPVPLVSYIPWAYGSTNLIPFNQHFSEFSEAYVVPGDIMTKGVDFLAEAERLRDAEEGGAVSLATLQGTLLLYERFVPVCFGLQYDSCFVPSLRLYICS